MAVVLHRDAHAAREDIDALARVMAAPDASPRLQSTFGGSGIGLPPDSA